MDKILDRWTRKNLLFSFTWRRERGTCDDLSSEDSREALLLFPLNTPPPIDVDKVLRYVER